MRCPRCGKYVKAKTGLLSRKKITCECGNVIDLKTDKLASRKCRNCGNYVVFDQTEGTDAKCPVCGESINSLAEQEQMVEFPCAQCGCTCRAPRGSTEPYACPMCGHVNKLSDIVRNRGIVSVIKYEGNNETLVWKHPTEDFNLGSQLIVHESQEAVFFRDGQALDLFGPGRYALETQQLPLLEKAYKLPTDGGGVFHSEVYYINMATQMGVKWGMDSKVRLFDPASGMHVELGASGEFNIRVINSRKLLLKIVGTTSGMTQQQLLGTDGKGFFRAMVMTQVKSYLASVIRENSISILEIDERLMELSEALRDKINPRLGEYGLEIPEFFVSRIVLPDDKNFQRMREQFAEQYLGVREEQIRKNVAEAEQKRKEVEARTEAQMKVIGAQGEAEALKVQKAAEAEAYKMQAEAEAAEMRMKGYTYQQETSRQVGMAAMQNGITGGGGSGGGLGDIAGLGVALGAMGGVIGLTKDALNPVMGTASQMGQALGGAIAGAWDCSCGERGISGNFCPNCGAKRIISGPKGSWTCPVCGKEGMTGKFCTECGEKRPEPATETIWDCECGEKGISGKFCPNCGRKKPE